MDPWRKETDRVVSDELDLSSLFIIDYHCKFNYNWTMDAPSRECHPVYWGLKSVLVRSNEYNTDNEYCALLKTACIRRNSINSFIG